VPATLPSLVGYSLRTTRYHRIAADRIYICPPSFLWLWNPKPLFPRATIVATKHSNYSAQNSAKRCRTFPSLLSHVDIPSSTLWSQLNCSERCVTSQNPSVPPFSSCCNPFKHAMVLHYNFCKTLVFVLVFRWLARDAAANCVLIPTHRS
jgi:hypothetical protein